MPVHERNVGTQETRQPISYDPHFLRTKTLSKSTDPEELSEEASITISFYWLNYTICIVGMRKIPGSEVDLSRVLIYNDFRGRLVS